MRFGSLFAGIGGFDLGLERAGMKCLWQVEIDPYATRVLEKHWSNVQRYSDIRDCGRHNLEPVDLICGGFPCQDISNAGKRAGIDGERSGLWSEYVRIIRTLRPRYVLVENVAALLVRGMGRVLGDLAESGYDAEWRVFSACEFGFPHTRERLFLIAYPQKDDETTPILSGIEEVFSRVSPIVSSYRGGGFRQILSVPNSGTYDEPRLLGTVNGLSYSMASKINGGIGNAVIPQIAEWIGRRILETEASSNLSLETVNEESLSPAS